jgi:acetoin utilization protein AcuB
MWRLTNSEAEKIGLLNRCQGREPTPHSQREVRVMDPNTREIPRERWSSFLALIEHLQKDRPVRVEVIGPQLGDQELAGRAQLRSISAPSKGTGARTIEIDLGVDAGLDHRVFRPVHVYAIQSSAGTLDCLDIEDESQTKTLIRFEEPPLLPEHPGAAPAPAPEIPVRQYMTPRPQALPAGSSAAQALDLLQRHLIRHLPILDEQQRLVGVLSDRDLALAKRERGIDPEDITVDELMVRAPYAVSPSTRIDEAAAVMATRKYGCAVVVEDGKVVGIFTTTDAMRALVELRAQRRGESLS